MNDLSKFQHVFFIGIAGTGMSAIAQYLQATGKNVAGSDRYFAEGKYNETQELLTKEGIRCFVQDGSGINENTDLIVVSTAVESTVPEVQKALSMGIPIIKRSELLALISKSKKTIAVGGTSGKSTTSAMLFQILETANLQPSIISGAGLISIIKEGKIGNAKAGTGDWLVIEADESDGSIVQYQPEVGLLLNIDKDHQEIDALMDIFKQFQQNTKSLFVVNQANEYAKQLSVNTQQDFSPEESIDAGYKALNFSQSGLQIQFTINDVLFNLNSIGKLNMENALAAVTVANQLGVSLEICAEALKQYEGIYRRHQILGKKDNVWVIDDYAHNPVKCAKSMQACQPIAKKLIAWFQPHGYGPTKFLRNDFVKDIAAVLREDDEIWMSEIFYAGGTAVKDISANDLINDLLNLGKKAFFVEDRKDLLAAIKPHLEEDTVILLMGARDPSLAQFTQQFFEQI